MTSARGQPYWLVCERLTPSVIMRRSSTPNARMTLSSRSSKRCVMTLSRVHDRLPRNTDVEILPKAKGWIKLSPLAPQPEPPNLLALKMEITKRWPMTSLLDVLKETDLRVDFTRFFRSPTAWEILDRATLQSRLLLALDGLGTGRG